MATSRFRAIVCGPILTAACFFLSCVRPVPAEGASPENLDEMLRRKQRAVTAAWPGQLLEDASNRYIWQPETLTYTDIQTGHEVWILTFGPGGEEICSKECSTNDWSVDGSRIGFFSMWRPTANPAVGLWHWRWVVNSDGSKMRACEGYGRVERPFEGFGWSRVVNAYYSFCSRADEGPGAAPSKLFKHRLDSNNVVTASLVIDTASANAEKKELVMEGVSGLDSWLVARGGTIFGTTPNPIETTGVYFIRLTPSPEIAHWWGVARGCGPAGDPYGNHEWSKEHHFHGVSSPGPDKTWILGVFSGTAVYWYFKRSGHYSDGGPLWEDWDGDSFGEYEEIRCVSDGAGTPDNPYGMPYIGHPAWDRWGRYAVSGTYTDNPVPGTRIWDIQNNCLLPHYVLAYEKYDGQHHSWTGWSDYVIGVCPDWPPGYEKAHYIYANKWYANYTDAIEVVDSHYGDYPPQSYNAHPRPSQSPDGTKVAFAQYMLHPGNYPYVAWAVVHHPYPPTNLAATYSNGVRLTWLPPTYTKRGWPNESTDPPPFAREIRRYHIWRSESQDAGWQEIASVGQSYEAHATYGHRPVIADCVYTDNPGVGTWYYAMTCEEWSGLESRELSEVLRVTVSGGAITSSSVVAPKGQKNFWTTRPPAPLGFSYAATGTPGQYRLKWTEPASGKARYYNIYYSTEGAPAPIQQNRIASVPVGTSKYLDWLANPDALGYYAITTVDRQGNESQPAGQSISDSQPPAAPTGLTATAVSTNQINLTWNASTDNVGVAGYRVHRNGNKIATTGSTSYPDTGLTPSTTYAYTVTAYDASGNESLHSDQVSGRTLSELSDEEPPAAPTGLVATAVSTTRIDLTWNASSDNVGVAGYRVYRNGEMVATAATTSYSDTGLTPATAYTYAVSAYDAAGNESPRSNEVSQQTHRPPNQPPVFLGNTPENVGLNKNVTASRSDYNTSAQMAVDGQGEGGNTWVAIGAPNWAVVDLGQDTSISRIKVNPFNVSGGIYYYQGAWNVRYATSSSPNTWLHFTEVVKNTGGGSLLGQGISIENGDPGSRSRDPAFLFYDFSFKGAEARYVRFECTVGDEDNDTNLNEIEVYTSGGIPNQRLASGGTLHSAFDLDDYFADADGDVLTYSSSGGVKVTVVIGSDNAVSFASSPGWSGAETITFTAADGKGGTATSNGVTVTVEAAQLPGAPGKPIHRD